MKSNWILNHTGVNFLFFFNFWCWCLRCRNPEHKKVSWTVFKRHSGTALLKLSSWPRKSKTDRFFLSHILVQAFKIWYLALIWSNFHHSVFQMQIKSPYSMSWQITQFSCIGFLLSFLIIKIKIDQRAEDLQVWDQNGMWQDRRANAAASVMLNIEKNDR